MPSRESKPAGVDASKEPALERFSGLATEWSGSSAAFALAALVIVVWLVTGPLFGFSDTWQLVINTGTTVVTFLMVFLIQRSQNKDSRAVHLKLNELVAAVQGASNRLINVEGLTEEEIQTLHDHYGRLVELAKADAGLTRSHSVEEAALRHSRKKGGRGRAAGRRTGRRGRKKKEDPGEGP
jgi:low affinity Fe/Cu permease